jgi:hypothetical protein
MITSAQLRRIALALPEAVEQDHHGRPSFRVRGAIFLTLWDEHHANLMLDPARIVGAVSEHRGACAELWWGKRLGTLQVDLRVATRAMAATLVEEAWRRKAPRSLLRG